MSMGLFLFGSTSAQAQDVPSQVTKPVGYVTHTLKAGQFNLLWLTVHNPVIETGQFTGLSETDLIDSSKDFDVSFTPRQTYILEITQSASQDLVGVIQVITSWSSATLNTDDDLQASGLSVGDQYQIR